MYCEFFLLDHVDKCSNFIKKFYGRHVSHRWHHVYMFQEYKVIKLNGWLHADFSTMFFLSNDKIKNQLVSNSIVNIEPWYKTRISQQWYQLIICRIKRTLDTRIWTALIYHNHHATSIRDIFTWLCCECSNNW